jgi:predicted 3-demethylubiquinone-9 3-methyltransferase (glyoxalase superfamily)
MKNIDQKIIPFLWFDNNAEEAMNFYIDIFEDASVKDITRWGKDGPGKEGSVLTANFSLRGQEFAVLNGGPAFNFTEAVSFLIQCTSQEEIDHYWSRLTADGGEESQCGWLKDKFGLSWQVAPIQLLSMIRDKDQAKSQRAMQAMMQMKKIDLKKIEDAFNG